MKHKVGNSLFYLLITFFSAIILIGCDRSSNSGGDSKKQPPQKQQWAKVTIAAPLTPQASKVQRNSSIAPGGPTFAALGRFEDVKKVTIDIRSAEGNHYTGEPLEKTESGWTKTLLLPMDVSLTITGHAFNEQQVEIFNGVTLTVLTEETKFISIHLSSIDDGVPPVLPIVNKLVRPKSVKTSESKKIQVYFSGVHSETLKWQFIAPDASSGTFEPQSGKIHLGSVNRGTLYTTYTAPTVDGNYDYKFRLINSMGHWVENTFKISVGNAVDNPDGSGDTPDTQEGLVVQFNPIVYAIGGERIGNTLKWTADVTDDAALNEIRYQWSYDGNDNVFSDPTKNPTIMLDYQPANSGTIQLTVTDQNGTGGSTTIAYQLPENQFPDNVVTNWAGTQQFGTNKSDSATAVAVAPNGDVYIAGNTSGQLGQDVQVRHTDIFLTKYDSSYVKQWVIQSGTSSNEYVTDVIVDPNGYVYVYGSTDGTFTGERRVGNKDLFLSKFHPNGERFWTKQFGSTHHDYATKLQSDSLGNIYLTGYTQGSMPNNSFKGGSYDLFLIKFLSTGTIDWYRHEGNSANEQGYGIVIDSNDNIYISGYSSGAIDGNKNLGSNDAILIKYNSQGEKLWGKQYGTTSSDVVEDLVIDYQENLYIVGRTSGTLDSKKSVGSDDVFIIKYSKDGTKLNSILYGSTGSEVPKKATIDSIGNIYISGYTSGAFSGFDRLGSNDMFLSKYDGEKSIVWTKQFGTSSNDTANGIIADQNDFIHIVGQTQGNLDGNLKYGDWDAFIMQFNSDGDKQ